MSTKVSKILHNPPVPLYYHDYRLEKPFSVHLEGTISEDCADDCSFISLNLAHHCRKKFPLLDLLFHLSIRPKDGELVRNSYDKDHSGTWGREERELMCHDGKCPIKPGQKFRLSLLVDKERVTGIVNENTVAFQFKFRDDPDDIQLFELHGPIELESVRFDFQ